MYDLRFRPLHSEHRRLVHEAIDAASTQDDRSIALIGVGSSHDTDLRALRGRFEAVTLVDIDRKTVMDGLAGQGVSETDIGVVAPFDVAGLEDLPLWGDVAGDIWLERVSSPPPLPGSPYDGAVSLCLLSQLMINITDRFTEQHPRIDDFIQAMRAAHLRFMLDGVRPGGWVVMLWDVVSSTTLPALLKGPFTRRRVARMAHEAFAAGNYFFGTPPQLFVKTFETDPWFRQHLAGYEIDRPWVWTDEPGHARMVFAMTLRRKA